MNSRERVRRAIEFRGPDRIPVRYYDDVPASDIIIAPYTPPAGWVAPEPGVDEWGCLWSTLDETLGQVKRHPMADPAACAGYRFPDPLAPGRLDTASAMRDAHPDRCVAGSVGISGFNRMTFLRGFSELLSDMVLAPERVAWLAERVFGFETEIIRRFAPLGVDAVWFWDDWGMQRGLMISPQVWRAQFKPRYARQFALAHQLGMRVVFHSCGNVAAILGDLVDIGADMLHLNQPDLLGIDWLASQFGGRVCLHCPVDTQNTLIHGSPQDIRGQARRLVERLGGYNGGFIACGDEGWGHGSVSPERLAIMRQAFEECRSGLSPMETRG
jgi:uroporphyrinogen decarboxylase